MPAGLGSTRSYLLRGAHPSESADSLEKAIVRLIQFWESRRSLSMHEWGNLVVTLVIGNKEVRFEWTDPALLDMIRRDPSEAVREVIEKMGLGPTLGADVLAACQATVQVDALRVPGHPTAWSSEAPADVVLPKAAPWMMAETLRQMDLAAGRGRRRRRNLEAKTALDALVKAGRDAGKSPRQIATEAGLPASTVRDTVTRQVREETGAPKPARLPRTEVQKALRAAGGNASAAARALNVPERTMRDARARDARLAAAATRPPPNVRDPATRTALLDAVKAGERPSIAAARLGIAPRTARGWAQEMRYGPKKKP